MKKATTKQEYKLLKKKKRPYVRRLEMLADMLENHATIFPKVFFNMNNWCVTKRGVWYFDAGVPQHCGSSACALGSAMQYPPFKKLGLKKKDGVPYYQGVVEYHAGAAFFNVPLDVSFCLFFPREYACYQKDDHAADGSGGITPARVAARVRHYVKLVREAGGYAPDFYEGCVDPRVGSFGRVDNAYYASQQGENK